MKSEGHDGDRKLSEQNISWQLQTYDYQPLPTGLENEGKVVEV
jgi:hypothetical protein